MKNRIRDSCQRTLVYDILTGRLFKNEKKPKVQLQYTSYNVSQKYVLKTVCFTRHTVWAQGCILKIGTRSNRNFNFNCISGKRIKKFPLCTYVTNCDIWVHRESKTLNSPPPLPPQRVNINQTSETFPLSVYFPYMYLYFRGRAPCKKDIWFYKK